MHPHSSVSLVPLPLLNHATAISYCLAMNTTLDCFDLLRAAGQDTRVRQYMGLDRGAGVFLLLREKGGVWYGGGVGIPVRVVGGCARVGCHNQKNKKKLHKGVG